MMLGKTDALQHADDEDQERNGTTALWKFWNCEQLKNCALNNTCCTTAVWRKGIFTFSFSPANFGKMEEGIKGRKMGGGQRRRN